MPMFCKDPRFQLGIRNSWFYNTIGTGPSSQMMKVLDELGQECSIQRETSPQPLPCAKFTVTYNPCDQCDSIAARYQLQKR